MSESETTVTPDFIHADYVQRAMRKRDDRMAEFETMGMKPRPGGCLGYIAFTATDAEKLLRMLRKANRTKEVRP